MNKKLMLAIAMITLSNVAIGFCDGKTSIEFEPPEKPPEQSSKPSPQNTETSRAVILRPSESPSTVKCKTDEKKLILGVAAKEWCSAFEVFPQIKDIDVFFEEICKAEDGWYLADMNLMRERPKQENPIYLYHQKQLDRLTVKPHPPLARTNPILLTKQDLPFFINWLYYAVKARPELTAEEMAKLTTYLAAYKSRIGNIQTVDQEVLKQLSTNKQIPDIMDYLLQKTPRKKIS